jgi:peptide chain release factor 3
LSSLVDVSRQTLQSTLAWEVARHRTFAIISHPDAGKTTLTEKLLLYTGAVDLAGAVRAKSEQRHTTSDWMAMEQERGISVTATALEMEYRGFRINLLDTPGHKDFSEDTYRTLMAVDTAVMVLDAAKGIEPQTEKLFHVCRMRGIPIITFINKMDQEGRDPFDLLDQIERVLGLVATPFNWPIGDGPWFQGVYDLRGDRVLQYERTARGQRRAPVKVSGLHDPALADMLGDEPARTLREHVDLLGAAGNGFDLPAFLRGEITPVYFGSALNNFGLEPFIEGLLELAPPPGPRESDRGMVDPTDEAFTGFVFKIQANMDPKHRDRMAFMRVCSGRFEKDMMVHHPRLGRSIRLSRAFRLFGRDREPIEEAFPGDVIGVVSPGLFAIGDTVTTGEPLRFPGIPRFAPENFGRVFNKDISKYKQFHKGLVQLEEEGAAQLLYAAGDMARRPILAVVGELQFDVVLARLHDEYGVEARIERLPYTCARWVSGSEAALERLGFPRVASVRCEDGRDNPVVLFESPWNLDYCRRENPDLTFSDVG